VGGSRGNVGRVTDRALKASVLYRRRLSAGLTGLAPAVREPAGSPGPGRSEWATPDWERGQCMT